MDLLNALSSQLGVDADGAQAVAGSLLGAVQSKLQDEDEPKAASGLAAAIPELGGWMDKAKALTGAPEAPAGGGLGGLLGGLAGGSSAGAAGALLGALGGEQAREMAAVVTVLSKLGVDSSKAALAAPLVLCFLKERLPEDLLSKVLSAAPLLAGSPAPTPASGVFGSLNPFA